MQDQADNHHHLQRLALTDFHDAELRCTTLTLLLSRHASDRQFGQHCWHSV